MVNIKSLLPELKKLVTELSEDLLKKVGSDSQLNAGLRDVYEQIEKGGRTAQAYEVWLEDYLDQVAVAWVLACVFVRFMEDNDLIDECWLAGEGGRRQRAEDAHTLYFQEHPRESDREYFEHVFREVGKIPAATDLFAEGKTPLWAVGPSGDAARNLLKFLQETETETGKLLRTFDVEDGDTRFLGDLYQELSARAKKKFALLQTPVFVEEFILDRTLTPALDEFGIEDVRMIDPTCGSGHFLLGAFDRLFNEWARQENNEITAAQNALDGVSGVDINPFAVAIARFRLIVAAMQACHIERLSKAPGWRIHVATGDSLLFGSRPTFGGQRVGLERQLDLFEIPEIYATEDHKELHEILGRGYHVVVGNPPYITVKDKAQNAAYRSLYSVCHRKYSLGVPFTQRFWELAIREDEGRKNVSGRVGLITTNSFMKREFGKKLIEEFFSKIDLTHILDTSGAYIPGHGTPTVVLFGRSRKPTSDTVRAVLGTKGEPSTPDDPAFGFVWQSVVNNVDTVDAHNEFTSTLDVPRDTFSSHPWSLGGGGASELKEQLDKGHMALKEIVSSIGFGAVPGDEDVFVTDAKQNWLRKSIASELLRPMAVGDAVRDWTCVTPNWCLFPYSKDGTFTDAESAENHFWRFRSILRESLYFGKTREQRGMDWREFAILLKSKMSSPMSIGFAEVATHNHFLLDREGMIFNRTAPVIKLHDEANVDEHLGLLGLLNSSTGCFWFKQSCHNKGSTVDQHGARQRTDPFEDFYQLNGTRVGKFPVPDSKPLSLSRLLDEISGQFCDQDPNRILHRWDGNNVNELMEKAKALSARYFGQMIALQEELDWHCYTDYGLLSEDGLVMDGDVPEICFGQRAFEIVMARRMESGDFQTTWFNRHSAKSITEIPTSWPEEYQRVVERRIEVIQKNTSVELIEKPEYKRRWNADSWEDREQHALKTWMLDRLESSHYWGDANDQQFKLQTSAELADRASRDVHFQQIASLQQKREDFDLSTLVSDLTEGDSVPLAPVLRYKPTGMRKRAIWERTWQQQRLEDGGEGVDEIPPPPKYRSTDFQNAAHWRLRGKLDVPKERWISFPHCERDGDSSIVIGWAGWNHLQQATAVVSYYDARKREGWSAAKLTPLLACLDQLLPWIHQWHPEIDPEYNETAGTSFQTLLESEAQELGLTLEDIRNWTPPKKKTKRKKKKS